MGRYLSLIGSILLGCYVVPMYHFVSNYPQVPLKDTLLVIALFGVVALGIAGLLWLLLRDINKVSFLMYGGVVIFWFSQDVCLLIAKFVKLPRFVYLYAWASLGFFSLILFLILFFILKFFSKFVKRTNNILSVFTFILSGLLLVNASWLELFAKEKSSDLRQNIKQNIAGEVHPNVYHILLDAHPNQKAMEIIGGDLKPFYNALETLGFITFPKSCSNYLVTRQSVASMLNMDYLHEDVSAEPKIFNHFIQHNYTLKIMLQSDILKEIYFYYGDVVKGGSFYSILYAFVSKTFIKHYFEDRFSKPFRQGVMDQLNAIAQSLSLGKANYGSTNNLFYGHFICPHEPCVFTKKTPRNLGFSGFLKKQDKSYQVSPEAHKLLCENVYGIDNLILGTIKEILEQYKSETIKPIIILHSDHSILNGSRVIKHPFITPDTMYGNLLALYIPDEWKQDAKNLKFINLYRWIFNHLFGDNFEYFKENMQK